MDPQILTWSLIARLEAVGFPAPLDLEQWTRTPSLLLRSASVGHNGGTWPLCPRGSQSRVQKVGWLAMEADELRGHVHFRPGGAASCLLARGSSALFLCCRSQPCSEVESHLFNLWLHSYICIASYRDKCVGLLGGHGGVRRVGYRHAE